MSWRKPRTGRRPARPGRSRARGPASQRPHPDRSRCWPRPAESLPRSPREESRSRARPGARTVCGFISTARRRCGTGHQVGQQLQAPLQDAVEGGGDAGEPAARARRRLRDAHHHGIIDVVPPPPAGSPGRHAPPSPAEARRRPAQQARSLRSSSSSAGRCSGRSFGEAELPFDVAPEASELRHASHAALRPGPACLRTSNPLSTAMTGRACGHAAGGPGCNRHASEQPRPAVHRSLRLAGIEALGRRASQSDPVHY